LLIGPALKSFKATALIVKTIPSVIKFTSTNTKKGSDMHPALISWLEDLKSYELSPHGEFWKVKKESEKVVITFTPDKQKPAVFAASITEVANPLKVGQSTFTLHCWAGEFSWMHAIFSSDESHAKWELEKFIKILLIGRGWFAEENKSSLNVPLEIKALSIFWLANNQENIGLSGFAHLIKNNMPA